MLTVDSLGKFQITDGNVIVGDEELRSNMLSKLLLYILLYRDKTLTIEDITTAVWQDEEIENPAGALKNLMYRLRKTLSKHFGNQDFILTNRGSYRWNLQVSVNFDIEQFDKLMNEAKQENTLEKAELLYEQAIALYQGDFMVRLTDMHWILTLNTYYHSLYLSCVKALSEIYLKLERYENLEKICTDALKLESGDEELYCYQIEARMRCGKVNLAMDSYEKAREIMEKELGVRKTTILNKVYDELMKISKGGSSYNFDEIKEDIYKEIAHQYDEFLTSRIDSKKALLTLCIAYVEFAQEYKNLFISLFLSNNLKWKSIENVLDEKWNQSTIINLVNKHGYSFEDAKNLFMNMWLYANGLATLIATNDITMDDQEVLIRLVKYYKILVKGE